MSSEDFKKFGAVIRDACIKNGITYIELSHRLGKSSDYIKEYKNRGYFSVRWLQDINLLNKFCSILNIELEYIIKISRRNVDDLIYHHKKEEYLKLHDDILGSTYKSKPRGFALLSPDFRKKLGAKGGKIGGTALYKKIGSNGMAQMGSIGGNKILEQKGRKHFVELSQKALKARGIKKRDRG